MVGNIASAQSRFMSATGGAAAHYGIGLNGEVRQWVSEGDTAWHAGNWDENLQSIGIEHEDNGNYNDGVRTDALYSSSIELVTDICRRYGLGADAIHIHKEFKATGCPDGLDVARIKNGVAAALVGVRTPAPAAPAPESIPFTPESVSVTITQETLLVRDRPTTVGSRSGLANTPDGALHQGNVASITGWTIGNDPYNDGRNVWLRSVRGNWFWAGGTNYHAHAGQGAPAVTTAAVQPEAVTDYTPVSEQVTVTGDGLAVRTAPTTSAPLNAANTAGGRLAAGTPVTITGYKTGENVSGNAIWLRSQYGNWLWSGGTNFTVPAPAPAAVEAPKAVDTVTEAAAPQADPDYVATFVPEAKLVVAIDDTEMVDFADQKPNVLVRKGVKVPTTGTFTHEGKEYYRYSSQNAENAAAYFGIPKEDCDTPTQGAVQVPKSIDGIRLPDKVVADADQLLQEVEAAPEASQSLVATIAALFGRIGAALDVPFSIISVLVGKRPSK